MPSWESLWTSTARFRLFGVSHQCVLAGLFLSMLGLIYLKPKVTKDWWFRFVLGLGIVFAECVFVVYPMLKGRFHPRFSLPLHLCDVAALCALTALVKERGPIYDFFFYWAFTGTLLATLTPELTYDFPHIEFFCFFATHALVVFAAFYQSFFKGNFPPKGAYLRVFLAVQVYALGITLVNIWLDSNYLFLRAKPVVASPFDYLGPWPVYVVALDFIFLGLLLLLEAIVARFRKD